MGICSSCIKKKSGLEDILIQDGDPDFQNDGEQEPVLETINEITVHNNSVTNTVINKFVDPSSNNSETDFTVFPYLKNRLIEIQYPIKNNPSKKPPINTINDEENTYSIFLFGDTDAGKTTFFNQFRVYIDDFSITERKSYTLRILATILEGIKKLYNLIKNENNLANFENEDLILELKDIVLEEKRKTYQPPPELFDKILSVWNDPIISKSFSENWKALHLCQFIPEFVSKISKYKVPNYTPENSDILYSKMSTLNNNINNRLIDDMFFASSSLSTSSQMLAFEFLDKEILLRDAGGMKSQRSKWKNFTFDAGLFFVSLSDFNLPVVDDDSESSAPNSAPNSLESEDDVQSNENLRIFESLRIFKDGIKKFFNGPQKPIFVLFTKYDLFDELIRKDNNCFKDVFPDFQGDPSNPDQCQKYIGNLFAKTALDYNPDIKIKICTSIDCLNCDSVFHATKKIVKDIKKL